MSNYTFAAPWFLLLLIPLVIFLGLYYWKGRKKRALKISRKTVIQYESWRVKLQRFVVPTFWILGLISFIIALARPQLMLKEEKVNAEGIDIMLVMDLSTSMEAEDFKPNRLEASKNIAIEFVDKREHDRIGLTVFAGEAYTQCPLTTDKMVISNFLADLQTGILKDGTAIGMGLSTAVNRLKESKAKSKIIILLTDGDNNAGFIQPLTAADIAEEIGVKVYTIGIGSDQPIVVNRGFFGSQQMLPKINVKLLNDIAERTNGKFFRATSEDMLAQTYAAIDQLEKTEIEVTSFKRYQDEFFVFIFWGSIFWLINILLSIFVLRKII